MSVINLGDGSGLDHLQEIGVTHVEWVLFTDHHREQCQGASRLKNTDIRVAAPEPERDLFEKPSEFRKMKVRLWDRFTINGSSYVRPPIQPIPLNRAFHTNDTFVWHGRGIICVSTPGASPDGMSYLLKEGDRWMAFSGDVMLDNARMHTWFDTEWDYGFGVGIQALRKSAALLMGHPLDCLLPAHGPVVVNPKEQLASYKNKLERLEKLYVRGYGVEGASAADQDKVSTPTTVSNVVQVSPHLFKFKRTNFWPNFNLILADNGHALASDCGLLDGEFLDTALKGLREHYGLKVIDAVVISHMHGDHFLEASFLREKWGAKIWAIDCMVDKMEHPEWFDYAAPIQAYGKKRANDSNVNGVHVDRVFKSGGTFEWEGHQFTVDWMPGQTEFALCLHGTIDPQKGVNQGHAVMKSPEKPGFRCHFWCLVQNHPRGYYENDTQRHPKSNFCLQ